MITNLMTDEQRKIYDRYKDIFPFNIKSFMIDIGLELRSSSELKFNQYGLIFKIDNDYKILINECYNPVRNLSIFACLLGHYFYSRQYLEDNGSIEINSKQASKKFLFFTKRPPINRILLGLEIRANKFAYEILMPKDKFIEVWQSNTNPEHVADFFNVSGIAVRIRAYELLGEIF